MWKMQIFKKVEAKDEIADEKQNIIMVRIWDEWMSKGGLKKYGHVHVKDTPDPVRQDDALFSLFAPIYVQPVNTLSRHISWSVHQCTKFLRTRLCKS